MKKHVIQLCIYVFYLLAFSVKGAGPKIDPIKFTLSTPATHVGLNEEFEIIITAEYLSIAPNVAFVLKDANSFRVKLTVPEGFAKTGGDYYDYIGAELTRSRPKVSFKLKGKFTSEHSDATFELLRSHRNADNQSTFAAVGRLKFNLEKGELQERDSLINARIAAGAAGFVPYMTIAQLRLGLADTAKVVQISQGDLSGRFIYYAADTTADDGVLTIVSNSGKRYKRQFDYIEAKWFSLKPGGISDSNNLAQFTKLFAKAAGRPIVFPSGQTYYLSNNIEIGNTLSIDFNGCKIVAPNGIVNRKLTNLSFSAGNYLTTVKNQMTFPKIAGVTESVAVGSIILIKCATPYNPVGNYYDGQLLHVVKVNLDGSFLIDKPIYKAFQVDTIDIYSGADLTIRNLELDMSTGDDAQKGFYTYCYKNVIIENVIAHGAKESACAFEILADNVRVNNCEAHGFLNTIGSGPGQRQGYGFSLNGNYVYAQSVRGSRCKHIITGGQRTVMTLDFHIDGFKGANPATEFNVGSGLSGGGPMYQAAIDFHGNCLNAFITNSEYDGCNGAIAIRNGNAIISNMKIRSRSVTSGFRNDYLINVYEHPVENIIVNDAEVYVDPPLSGQTDLASLIGVQSGLLVGANKNIIVNNLTQDGGKLFNMNVASAEGSECNIDKIVFKGVTASLDAGINIAGTSGFLTGTIGRIELQGNITIKPNADKTLRLVNAEYVGGLNELILKNSYFDCTNITEAAVVRVNFSGNSTPPSYMDFSNSHLICGATGLTFANLAPSGSWGRAIFDGMKLDFNKGAKPSLTFIPGVYGSLEGTVAGEWTFKGTKIRNLSSVSLVSNFECLLFPKQSKLNIDNVDINTDINVADASYFTTLGQQRLIPYTAKNTSGHISFLGYRIKDGKLFLPSSSVTNPTLATATPNTITPLFNSQIIYHDGYNGVSPFGWISYNGLWKKLMATD
jgi:hypothetical protein